MATESINDGADVQIQKCCPSFALNEQQQDALTKMLAFVSDDHCSAFTLKGYAGTGKTTTIQQLLGKLVENGIRRKIFFTAPTHKAVKVLRKMSEAKGIDVECLTIHSLLGLKVVTKEDTQKIEPVKYRANDPLKNCGKAVVVIDECSMIGEELFKHIQSSIHFYDVQYIFMGDPAQLPPVGERESTTFESSSTQATLTQVMRQRGENPVLGVCTDIREAWARGDFRLPKIISGMADDGSVGVSILHGAMFGEWMPTAFSHENFDKNNDRFRVIAWRNETVDRINKKIHDMRYPVCETWLALGEPVAFVKPMQNSCLVDQLLNQKNDEIIVQTDFEGAVIECEKANHPHFKQIPCWIVTAQIETGEVFKFYALDSVGAQIRDNVLKTLAMNNRENKKAGRDHLVNWIDYYAMKSAFASIRPAYCLTAHKSQGSTFENVFVDVADIWANPNKSEALQCLYVACSRASHHLIVNTTGA